MPFSFWALTFALFNIGELGEINFIKTFSFELMIVGLAVLLVSIIYQFYKRKWLGAIISTLAFGGTFMYFLVVALAHNVKALAMWRYSVFLSPGAAVD